VSGTAGSGTMDASPDGDASVDDVCRRAGDNCMFVAWVTSTGRIAYAGTNTQGNWSQVRTIPTRSTPVCVTLAVLREDNGNRFLWAFWSTAAGGIDWAYSGNGFGWSPPDTAVANGATATCPAAAGFQPGATGNRTFLAWTAPDGSVKYATNTGVGAFSAPGQIAPAASTTLAPTIENVIEGDGTVRLWAAWPAADGSLQWARGDGATWQTRGLAFPANTSITTPALGAMRDHGNYYGWLAWRRADGALLYGFTDASAWDGPVGIAPPGSTAVSPALGAWQLQATDGLMWVAWTQGTSIQYDTSDGVSPFNAARAVPGATDVAGPPALQAF
jgi:hypothetical protein